MQGFRHDLARDIECYTCGEEPSPLLMLRAPRLEGWKTQIRRRGKAFVMVVTGTLTGHPKIRDGESIVTSGVAWFDRRRRFVRTHTRLYSLGETAEQEIPLEGIDV